MDPIYTAVLFILLLLFALTRDMDDRFIEFLCGFSFGFFFLLDLADFLLRHAA